MDRSQVLTLIKEVRTQDELKIWHSETVKREVFAQVDSVTRSEFFEGGRSGLNPEFRFTLFAPDYEGELEVIYNGERYVVYRTYFARTDIIELYVERKGGTNGKIDG